MGFGAPMREIPMAYLEEPEEGDGDIDTEDDLGSPETLDQVVDSEGSPEGDLLSVVSERYADEDGSPVE